MPIDFAKEARDLKAALAENAFPAVDGSADIDNHALPIIEVTLREIARRAVEEAAAKEKPLDPPSFAEIEAEAERCSRILNDLPPNYYSDEMYAAYNALLFVLGYGVELPSVLWGRRKSRAR